jgi:glycerol-3-phosphate dehydrogenase
MLTAASPGETRDLEGETLSGTHLPLRFVRRVLREEWCCRLSDLVERRLMLVFAGDLSMDCLRQLARLMVEEGLLPGDRGAAEVDACAQRLRTHFGRAI